MKSFVTSLFLLTLLVTAGCVDSTDSGATQAEATGEGPSTEAPPDIDSGSADEDESRGISVKLPGVEVRVNEDEGVSVKAPGTDVSISDEGVDITAPGTDVSVREDGVEITAPGVDIKSPPEDAPPESDGDDDTAPESESTAE